MQALAVIHLLGTQMRLTWTCQMKVEMLVLAEDHGETTIAKEILHPTVVEILHRSQKRMPARNCLDLHRIILPDHEEVEA